MKPFLKWAGSKKWLVRQGIPLPHHGFRRYIEPFLGSGAVFFNLLPQTSVLSDSNRYLINCYREIQTDWKAVFFHYKRLFANHNKENYYAVRRDFQDTGSLSAGQFIYLNRACFNGVFRVNLAGQFNVPIGSKITDPFEERDFEGWATALVNAELKNCDFEKVIDDASEGDLLFIDPPYTVAHNQNGFIEYNEKIFSWDDQVRLASSVMKAN